MSNLANTLTFNYIRKFNINKVIEFPFYVKSTKCQFRNSIEKAATVGLWGNLESIQLLTSAHSVLL